MARANQVFKFQKLVVDKTGIGDAVVDEMQYINIPNVEGVFLTEPVKEDILNHLKFVMEKKQLGILGDDAQLIAQLNEQQYEYLKPKTAQERIHLKFWHPQGRQDFYIERLKDFLPKAIRIYQKTSDRDLEALLQKTEKWIG